MIIFIENIKLFFQGNLLTNIKDQGQLDATKASDIHEKTDLEYAVLCRDDN